MASRSRPIDAPTDLRQALGKATGARNAARQSFENLLNERQNQILGLSERVGPNSETYRDAVEERDKARLQYERINAVVRRPLNNWRLHGVILLGVGLVLALFEAPVNKFLFDVALRTSNLMSWFISFAFACALLFLAHFAGVSLRHVWSDYRRRPVIGSILLFLVLAMVLLTLVSILTVARAAYGANAGTIGDMFADVSSAVASVGLFRTLFNAFSDISALVLATINIGGIFMTMMLAFFTHDSDKDLDAASRALDRQRRHVAKISAVYLAKKAAIVKDFAPDLAGAGHDFKNANQKVVEYKTRLGLPPDEDDTLMIDQLDRLAEDSRYADDVDDRFERADEGDLQPVQPGSGPTLVRRESA